MTDVGEERGGRAMKEFSVIELRMSFWMGVVFVSALWALSELPAGLDARLTPFVALAAALLFIARPTLLRDKSDPVEGEMRPTPLSDEA